MTYTERSQTLANESSVAVLVLMGAPDDIELVMIKPKPADAKTLLELKDRWPGRGLRSIGVMGLVGLSPQIALKEPLEPRQIDALASAFLTYVNVLLFGEQPCTDAPLEQRGDAVDWLEHLYSLPDTRPENIN
jgi:hypothetical protein